MVHTISGFGLHVALDVNSGAIHLLDAPAAEVLAHMTPPVSKDCPPAILTQLSADPDTVREIWAELHELYAEGLLFSEEDAPPPPQEPVLKALCLHVAHDCNLRCGYCFAGTGHFGGGRSLMEPETAVRAIRFLAAHSGARRNLEVDFFGGEPLLAMPAVRAAVDYARAHEAEWGKHFRFTLTTNGLALDDETIDYLNATMDNVVLSLDGLAETHDALRKTTGGQGSYREIAPLFQKLVAHREGDYFVRGTFTAKNPDFVDDVLHLCDELGFTQLSMEPVVLAEGHPLALTEALLPVMEAAYERLTESLLRREEVSFFHYQVDLSGGPCVYKRLKGCGAGKEYAAVTPDGEFFPCHQFVGQAEYRMGSLEEGITFRELRGPGLPEGCRDCWAKYFCSGGCAASNKSATGSADTPYALGCALTKKRLEQAILLSIRKLQKQSAD